MVIFVSCSLTALLFSPSFPSHPSSLLPSLFPNAGILLYSLTFPFLFNLINRLLFFLIFFLRPSHVRQPFSSFEFPFELSIFLSAPHSTNFILYSFFFDGFHWQFYWMHLICVTTKTKYPESTGLRK